MAPPGAILSLPAVLLSLSFGFIEITRLEEIKINDLVYRSIGATFFSTLAIRPVADDDEYHFGDSVALVPDVQNGVDNDVAGEDKVRPFAKLRSQAAGVRTPLAGFLNELVVQCATSFVLENALTVRMIDRYHLAVDVADALGSSGFHFSFLPKLDANTNLSKFVYNTSAFALFVDGRKSQTIGRNIGTDIEPLRLSVCDCIATFLAVLDVGVDFDVLAGALYDFLGRFSDEYVLYICYESAKYMKEKQKTMSNRVVPETLTISDIKHSKKLAPKVYQAAAFVFLAILIVFPVCEINAAIRALFQRESSHVISNFLPALRKLNSSCGCDLRFFHSLGIVGVVQMQGQKIIPFEGQPTGRVYIDITGSQWTSWTDFLNANPSALRGELLTPQGILLHWSKTYLMSSYFT
jgi:hypothetical protein